MRKDLVFQFVVRNINSHDLVEESREDGRCQTVPRSDFKADFPSDLGLAEELPEAVENAGPTEGSNTKPLIHPKQNRVSEQRHDALTDLFLHFACPILQRHQLMI